MHTQYFYLLIENTIESIDVDLQNTCLIQQSASCAHCLAVQRGQISVADKMVHNTQISILIIKIMFYEYHFTEYRLISTGKFNDI